MNCVDKTIFLNLSILMCVVSLLGVGIEIYLIKKFIESKKDPNSFRNKVQKDDLPFLTLIFIKNFDTFKFIIICAILFVVFFILGPLMLISTIHNCY